MSTFNEEDEEEEGENRHTHIVTSISNKRQPATATPLIKRRSRMEAMLRIDIMGSLSLLLYSPIIVGLIRN